MFSLGASSYLKFEKALLVQLFVPRLYQDICTSTFLLSIVATQVVILPSMEMKSIVGRARIVHQTSIVDVFLDSYLELSLLFRRIHRR